MAESAPKSVRQQVLSKFVWAKEHINKLNAALRVYHDLYPVPVFTKTDSKTGDLSYYVRKLPTGVDPENETGE